jgi:hypothetical protein
MVHEKMYQCALQGYEKVLSHEQVNTYIPAPNKAQKVTVLYEQIGRANEAEDVYFRALRSRNGVRAPAVPGYHYNSNNFTEWPKIAGLLTR